MKDYKKMMTYTYLSTGPARKNFFALSINSRSITAQTVIKYYLAC